MTSIYSAVIKKIDPSSNEEYELSHVPIESRKGIVQMAIVFVGYTFTPSTLVYGGAWAGNLKLTDFVISQGIGFAFAALLSTTVGSIAMSRGLTFHLACRYFFGNLGARLPSLILTFTRIGWAAVNLALIADIASTIYPQIPFTAFVILLGVLITSTALYGFDAMQTISYISIPVVILVFLFGTIKLGINFTGSNPTAPTSFTAAIGSGTSYWLAAAVISGDWLRYSDSYKTVAASATVGLFGVSLLFVSLGFFTVLATGTANIVRAMVDTGIIFPAAIGLLGLVWTTVDNELYSASLGIANIFETKKIFGVIVAGGSVLVLSGFKFHELILPYVTAIGVLIPPIPAIWLVEYYIFRNRMKETNIDRISYKVNWLAIISCIGGSVTGLIVPKNYVAPIISMMITGLTYLLLVYTLSEQDVYPRTLASSPR